MNKKITFKNILYFIEGNIKMLGDIFHLIPHHEKEQVLWRMEICKDDCMKDGYCKYCGCDVPGKLYVNDSCNGGERFPDLMTKSEWEQYKQDNNITVIQ
jgi:hypothetical protein